MACNRLAVAPSLPGSCGMRFPRWSFQDGDCHTIPHKIHRRNELESWYAAERRSVPKCYKGWWCRPPKGIPRSASDPLHAKRLKQMLQLPRWDPPNRRKRFCRAVYSHCEIPARCRAFSTDRILFQRSIDRLHFNQMFQQLGDPVNA